MFQNLRENQQIYVLTKAPVPSLDMGTVIKIQGPVPNFQAGSNMMGYTMDITVAVNGINRPFPQLPVNKDSAEYINEQTIIAMSRDAMNAELNSLKNESVNAIQRGREEEAKLPIPRSGREAAAGAGDCHNEASDGYNGFRQCGA